MAVTAKDFDQPIVFAFAVFFVVVGLTAVGSTLFTWLGWSGPLGLLKGGVMQ